MTIPQGIEILVVEDNEEDAELTLRALKKNNLANKVFIVRDGAEALDYLYATGPYAQRDAAEIPKLILLDLKLPKVNGIEVLTRIRQEPRTKMVPVVVMTSSQEGPDVQACYKIGANSYITKPVEFEQFMDVVSKLGLYWLLINKLPY